MLLAVVEEVEGFGGRGVGVAGEGEVVDGLLVAIVEFIAVPGFGHVGGEVEVIALFVEPEEGFHEEAVEPAGGADVSGPAAAADVRGVAVDVGGGERAKAVAMLNSIHIPERIFANGIRRNRPRLFLQRHRGIYRRSFNHKLASGRPKDLQDLQFLDS